MGNVSSSSDKKTAAFERRLYVATKEFGNSSVQSGDLTLCGHVYVNHYLQNQAEMLTFFKERNSVLPYNMLSEQISACKPCPLRNHVKVVDVAGKAPMELDCRLNQTYAAQWHGATTAMTIDAKPYIVPAVLVTVYDTDGNQLPCIVPIPLVLSFGSGCGGIPAITSSPTLSDTISPSWYSDKIKNKSCLFGAVHNLVGSRRSVYMFIVHVRPGDKPIYFALSDDVQYKTHIGNVLRHSDPANYIRRSSAFKIDLLKDFAHARLQPFPHDQYAVYGMEVSGKYVEMIMKTSGKLDTLPFTLTCRELSTSHRGVWLLECSKTSRNPSFKLVLS
jgi:hypothetical protein